jgi:hypothetical protein
MIITDSRQVDQSVIEDPKYDIFIGASGYESRASYIFSKGIHAKYKYILAFLDRVDTPQRAHNNEIFINGGADLYEVQGSSAIFVRQYILKILADAKLSNIKILVDYTSMTKTWYAGIISAFTSCLNIQSIECNFVYSPSLYLKPNQPISNGIVDPIDGFCGISSPDRPTALVVGLGYEYNRAIGLMDYIDPAVCYAFYTDPATDIRFRNDVVNNNKLFIDSIQGSGFDKVFKHSIWDMDSTSNQLFSLCSGLRDNYRVIIAPLGTKPFSLLSLLIATRFNDIDVWRVSDGTHGTIVDHKPNGKIIAYHVDFSCVG